MILSHLTRAIIKDRYKRFLTDIELPNGETIVAHLANTGSMKSCWEPGMSCLLSYHDNPKRKLKYSVEMIDNGKTLIGVNTHNTNKIVHEALKKGVIKELINYDTITPEKKVGKSRIDFLLSSNGKNCFVEVKSVTLKNSNKRASFPDAVTKRGQKHIDELINIKKNGDRAVLLFVIQREDIKGFEFASDIDPEYAEKIKIAKTKGVEILIYQTKLTEESITISHSIKES